MSNKKKQYQPIISYIYSVHVLIHVYMSQMLDMRHNLSKIHLDSYFI